MKWWTRNFIQKYEHFNDCAFVVQANNNLSFHVMNDMEQNDFRGVFGGILNLFAKKHRAIVDRTIKYLNGGILLPIEISVHFSFEYRDSKMCYHLTPSVYQHEVVFMIVKETKLTQEKKLILPFDTPTWCLIIASISLGYFSIFIIYLLPLSVKHVAFDSNNKTPSLNLTKIFFGISLTVLPRNYFARLLFIMFTFYCLIIRTAYQSKMYDFLQYDIRPSRAETVQEVLSKNIQLIENGISYNKILQKDL